MLPPLGHLASVSVYVSVAELEPEPEPEPTVCALNDFIYLLDPYLRVLYRAIAASAETRNIFL